MGILRIEQKARMYIIKYIQKQTKKNIEAAMISNILGGRKMIPVVEKMEVFPVAGHDCMELNLSGAHAPYFTRNIVILTDSNGVEGVGEVPGGEKITKHLSR